MSDSIVAGSEPSYQICKTLYAYHPLGARMAESPISMAQSQEREIAVTAAPEDDVKEAFQEEWRAIGADRQIFNTAVLARVYGVATLAAIGKEDKPSDPIDFNTLAKRPLGFNSWDPLNTAGSLVLNQDPNAPDFQKPVAVAVQGVLYHPSRCVVIMNGSPLYIEYTTSAFGYTGRSVYQRGLFPLKSFINTMIADDMVARKVGLLVAKIKQPGSIIDNVMAMFAAQKRELLKEAETNNVLSISAEDNEDVTSLNLQNLEAPHALARKNILENIATSADMPAKLLNSETFAEGFGEGTEDAKHVARYVDRVRVELDPLYRFFDRIVMTRAWTPEFYLTMQNKYPEKYKGKDYTTAFMEWCNSFKAKWPSLLTEPESERIKVDDVKLKAVLTMLDTLLPYCDPDNKALLITWACDNFNELKLMFGSELILDAEAMATFEPPVPEAFGGEGGEGEASETEPKDKAAKAKEPKEKSPKARADSVAPGRNRYSASVEVLLRSVARHIPDSKTGKKVA